MEKRMEDTINWKTIELSDKQLIDSFYRKEPAKSCEFTFANNYLWAPHYDIRFGIVEEQLVFLSRGERTAVSFPAGGEEKKAAIDALDGWFKEIGEPFALYLVTTAQFERLEEMYPGRFQIEYDRDAADYVYESEKLITLAGKKLHAKRNHINRFRENYPDFAYERISDENVEECKAMALEWKKENDCEERGEKHKEFCVTMNALDHYKELELRGGLIRAGGRVVAFSLGEPCCRDIFVVHIEKAFAGIPGAYPIINQQFVEHEASNYKYINREEDTGEEGLRKAKLSYRPAFLLEKGLVTERRL